MMAVWMTAISFWMQLLLVCFTMIHLIYAIRVYYYQIGKKFQSIRMDGNECWLIERNNKYQKISLTSHQYVSQWLIILNFEVEHDHTKVTLLLFKDSEAREQLRKVRVFVKSMVK